MLYLCSASREGFYKGCHDEDVECALLLDSLMDRVRTTANLCHEWPWQHNVRYLTWAALPVPKGPKDITSLRSMGALAASATTPLYSVSPLQEYLPHSIMQTPQVQML